MNKSNTSPTDIVSDGVSIWVVDDSTTDKVFKYTLTGSLLGSWTISGGGGSPTGITIDPSNVSDIWIVDTATDRVYQFIAAASRTSGSLSPASSFALAAGNANPQGIADPPPSVDATPVGWAEAAEAHTPVVIFPARRDEMEHASSRGARRLRTAEVVEAHASPYHLRSLIHSAAVDQLLSGSDDAWTHKSRMKLRV